MNEKRDIEQMKRDVEQMKVNCFELMASIADATPELQQAMGYGRFTKSEAIAEVLKSYRGRIQKRQKDFLKKYPDE